ILFLTLASSALSKETYQSCSLVKGNLACWGSNDYGQLGVGDYDFRSRPANVHLSAQSVSVGSRHTCAVGKNGKIYCWGENYSLDPKFEGPKLRPLPTEIETGNLTFSSVSAGSGYTCAITTGGKIYCWGANDHGQLGVGDYKNRPEPTEIIGDHPLFTSVS